MPISSHARRSGWKTAVLTLVVLTGTLGTSSLAIGQNDAGREIYETQCAACHGKDGMGVAGKYERSFSADSNWDELVATITETMPESAPEECVGEDAEAVARFIVQSFLTGGVEPAQPRIELLRLTASQYDTAVADLFAPFLPQREIPAERGIKVLFYNDQGPRQDKLVLERVDQGIRADWLEKSPLEEKLDPEKFCVVWEGSIFAPETGTYDFQIESVNGYQLFVNRLDDPLINSWVATIDEPVKTESIKLVGGRWYAIKLMLRKVKDPQVALRLQWRPPRRQFQGLSIAGITPVISQPAIIASTPFPADDRSVGYERGTLVTREWDGATTEAAFEIAEMVSSHLRQFAGASNDDHPEKDKCLKFCRDLARRAFRRPLSGEERERYITSFFQQNEPREAVKGSVAAILKSPWFLYIGLNDHQSDAIRSAEQVAWTLWDSLPDEDFQSETGTAEIKVDDVRRWATEMVADPRARAKLRSFFVEWLDLDDAADLAKDTEVFAGFDDLLADDLQESALRFVEDVAWSESSDFRELLLADYLWMSPRMERFYLGGAANELTPSDADPEGERDGDAVEALDADFRRVPQDASERAGVLTHPVMLSQLAYFRNTSPIHRGVFISRKIMGIGLKPPPIAVEPLGEEFNPEMTTRERVEFQTRPANCMACHQVINPLGFTLEGLDAVGRRREVDRNRPVDTRVDLRLPDGQAVTLNGPRELAGYLVDRRETYRHFVEQMFHHLVKQPVAAYGASTLDRLTDRFMEDGCHIRNLMIDIAVLAACHDWQDDG